jgi:phosphatidylserine/phosphatidylglycerophosphate/cardiolipin synthase-like enzyme
MNEKDELSYGDPQTADIELRDETYPGQLNVAFTRGFVSSQAFIDKYGPAKSFGTLIPAKADDGPTFVPTHPKAKEALDWMGFESRNVILGILDEAIKDKTAQVQVVAYDLNESEIISRLAKLGKRLRILIDDSGTHKPKTSGESQAEATLVASAGRDQVKRQHMGQLEHNKTITVSGEVNKAICGSTNFSWRGLFVQSNNAIVVEGKASIQPFVDSFENFWNHSNDVAGFSGTPSAKWNSLNLDGIDAKVTFSPHSSSNAMLDGIAKDTEKTTSSLFFSLAFLYQTPGAMKDAIIKVTNKDKVFVYGISDKEVGGLDVKTPNGNEPVTAPAALSGKSVPQPFKSEATGGSGVRLHHKFLVIDFDKPNARVYMGSYNFSVTADNYHFRVAQQKAETAQATLELAKPPRAKGELPWWDRYYTDPLYIRDRKLFAASSA